MKRLLPFLACAALLILTGCATQGVKLPPLPPWPAPVAGVEPARVSNLQLRLATMTRFPGVSVHISDGWYTPVPHAWLVDYLAWTKAAAWHANVNYTPHSFDCEDFSVLFTALAGLAASKVGLEVSPLMARIVVDGDGDTLHEMVGVVTDRGEFVVEPQPNAALRLVPLAEFPRRIHFITFGDASQ